MGRASPRGEPVRGSGVTAPDWCDQHRSATACESTAAHSPRAAIPGRAAAGGRFATIQGSKCGHERLQTLMRPPRSLPFRRSAVQAVRRFYEKVPLVKSWPHLLLALASSACSSMVDRRQPSACFYPHSDGPLVLPGARWCPSSRALQSSSATSQAESPVGPRRTRSRPDWRM
jgi:hypothetical protein